MPSSIGAAPHQFFLANQVPAGLPGDTLVRIAGRFKCYDAADDALTLEFKGAAVDIDTHLLAPMPFDTMSQIEVFGTYTAAGRVEAKILKCINGVDLNLYERIGPILQRNQRQQRQEPDPPG